MKRMGLIAQDVFGNLYGGVRKGVAGTTRRIGGLFTPATGSEAATDADTDPIQCFAADFGIVEGVATARVLALDTGEMVMLGNGPDRPGPGTLRHPHRAEAQAAEPLGGHHTTGHSRPTEPPEGLSEPPGSHQDHGDGLLQEPGPAGCQTPPLRRRRPLEPEIVRRSPRGALPLSGWWRSPSAIHSPGKGELSKVWQVRLQRAPAAET